MRTRVPASEAKPKRAEDVVNSASAKAVKDRLQKLGALCWCESFCLSQGVTLDAVLSIDKHPSIARARRRMWTLLKWTLDLSAGEVARLMDVNHTSILHAEQVRRRELEMEAKAL